MQPQANSGHPVHNPLGVMQEGEQIISEIKRHPIGLLLVLIAVGTFVVFLAVLAFVVIPGAAEDNDSVSKLAMGGFAFMSVLALVFATVYNFIYWDNNLVVTSDSITEISRTSLFNKESSQLSLGNLEDVKSTRKGLLQTLFDYGTLTVETAGEHVQFAFPWCPDPDSYARKILAAREAFEQSHHGGKVSNDNAGQPSSGQDSSW